MILATDFLDENEYYAALDEHVASDHEAMGEMAWNMGHQHADHQWLLDDRDVWVRNPHYAGPPQRHPEDDCDED